jgi:hypothetical protein
MCFCWWWCCCAPPLDASSFENGYSTTEKLVYSAVSKELLGWEVTCEVVCEMHVSQLLQTLSLLTAEHTNSSVVE